VPAPPSQEPRRRVITRRFFGAGVGALLAGWVARRLFEEAAPPLGPKACAYVYPPAPAHAVPPGTATPALPPPTRPAEAPPPFVQRGGTINDASCLNRTPVYGIVEASDAAGVARALGFARRHGLRVTAAGARHSMGGQSFVRDGLVLDLRRMNRMALDRGRLELTVESGARWADVQRFLDARGCAVKAMQSINIFSLGGALSVNGHGIAHDPGPVAATVRSLSVMTAAGEIVTASPAENRDLFRAVLGGYGLLGVILDARLDVVPNVMYRRRTRYMDYREVPEFYRRHVAGDPRVGLFFGRLSVSPLGYLREAAVHTFTVAAGAGLPPPIAPLPAASAAVARLVFNNSKGGGAGRLLRWALEKHLQPLVESCVRAPAGVGADGAGIAGEGANATDDERGAARTCLVSRNQQMYESMEFLRNRLADTDILQEYFVPHAALPAFADGLRAVIAKRRANLLNVTIRRVAPDTVTALPYATSDAFALVLYFNQRFDDGASRALDDTTRDLIDLALRLRGTYYLPYRLCYSRDQLLAAYPGFDDFLRIKSTWDPAGLFTNEMYERYRV
jgi:FAD/FMN-containing dehydrogenase